MDKLPDYIQAIQEGKTLVANHTRLLESLLLSRQANDKHVYTDETTNGISDGNVNASEGSRGTGEQESS